MRKLLTLLLLIVFCAFSQVDDPATDTFTRRLASRAPRFKQRIQRYLANHPDATLADLQEDGIRYERPDGSGRGFFGRQVSHVDPDTGQRVIREPELWETDKGYAMKGVGIRARVVHRPAINKTDVGVFQKLDGNWVGFGMRLPTLTYAGDFDFTAGAWRVELGGLGFRLVSELFMVARGVKVYSFPYTTRGMTVAPDEQGNLSGDHGWELSRAVMVGANREAYPCEAWQVVGNETGFRCDDTTLPAEAFPYFIDPVSTFYSASSASREGWGVRASCTNWFASCASETYATASSQTDGNVRVYRTNSSGSWTYHQYFVDFNTSSLPDDGRVVTGLDFGVEAVGGTCGTPASSKLYISVRDRTAYTIGTDDFYTWPDGNGLQVSTCGGWTFDATEYKEFALTGGFTSVDMADYTEINLAMFNTGLGFYTSASIWVHASTYGSNDPYLEVTYDWPPSATQVIIVNSDD